MKLFILLSVASLGEDYTYSIYWHKTWPDFAWSNMTRRDVTLKPPLPDPDVVASWLVEEVPKPHPPSSATPYLSRFRAGKPIPGTCTWPLFGPKSSKKLHHRLGACQNHRMNNRLEGSHYVRAFKWKTMSVAQRFINKRLYVGSTSVRYCNIIIQTIWINMNLTLRIL